MTPQTTSPDANVDLIRASLETLNAGDLDACMDLLAPDFVINLAELPDPMYGRETWRQGVDLMKRAFPDLEANVKDIFAADDRVAVRLTLSGTHAGEFLGVPATGRR